MGRFGGGNTVYDRLQKTGYITGSHHAMGPAMEDEASEPPAPASDAGGPPNLRDSVAPGTCNDCGNSANSADSSGGLTCMKYSKSVSPNQVCDDFETKGGMGNGEETSEGPGTDPEALQAR